MLVCDKIRLNPTRADTAELRLVGDRVSRLWNAANYLCRQSFLAKTGVPTGYRLEALIKPTPEYRQLPSDIAQEVIKKLSEAWYSYFALRKIWAADPSKDKPGLPKYRKDRKTNTRPDDFIPLKCPRAYSVAKRDVALVLPRDRRATRTGGRLQMPYRGRRRHQGSMGRAEVCYDQTRKRYYLSWSVLKSDPKPHPGQKTAAVDLGVRVIASLSIEGVAQAWHFEGRELLKDWDYLGQQIALEQAHIAGTRREKGDKPPYSRAIGALYAKRRQRLEHGLRVAAKEIATTCKHHGVGMVYLGWPKDIRRERDYGALWNGRIHGFWAFDHSLSLIAQALAACGIASKRVGERGSSSTCPACRSRKVVRSPRWRLTCRTCSEVIHADQAGSRNICIEQKPSISWAGVEATPRTATTRWTRHRWHVRCANPRWREPEGLIAA